MVMIQKEIMNKLKDRDQKIYRDILEKAKEW